MREHGTSGRTFAGRVLQVITGSTGLDDYEWGVTLFAVHPDDLKEVVYTMRYDRASAIYAEFGPFYAGMVTPLEDLLAAAPDGEDAGGVGLGSGAAARGAALGRAPPVSSNANRS